VLGVAAPALSGMRSVAASLPSVGMPSRGVPMAPVVPVDEWGGEAEQDAAAKAEVKVEVAALKQEEEDVEEQVKGPIWKKKEGEEKERALPNFPTLGATGTAQKQSSAPVPGKAAGFQTHANQFAELHQEDREDEEKKQKQAAKKQTAEEKAAAERKAAKKAAKKAEKEARIASQEAEKENEENAEFVCKIEVEIDGKKVKVKDTDIKQDLDKVNEKYIGRRKLERQPLDEQDEDQIATRKRHDSDSDQDAGSDQD